mgnify:CR=1 FL=1
MGKCDLDHSLEDVQNKLNAQSAYLPESLYQRLQNFLSRPLSQETLNDAFHLLKKYDLASEEERENRNSQIEALLSG